MSTVIASDAPPKDPEPPKEAAPEAPGAGGGLLSKLADLAVQALPAIGSAVGFLGFVAFVGAAIEWIRFSAAGLPADQAVRVVPRQELVTIGAAALVGYTAGALLAVLVVYLLDRQGNATVATLRGLVAVALVEMLVTVYFIRATTIGYLLLIAWLVVVAVLAAGSLAQVIVHVRERSQRTLIDDVLRAARERWEAAVVALERVRHAEQLVAEPAPTPPHGGPGPAPAPAPWWRRLFEPPPPAARPPEPAPERVAAQAAVRAATLEAWSAQQDWHRALEQWAEFTEVSDLQERRGAVLALGDRDEPPTAIDLDGRLQAAEAPRRSLVVMAVTYPFSTIVRRLRVMPDRRRQVGYVAFLILLVAAALTGAVLVIHFASSRWLAAMFVVVVGLGVMNLGVARVTRTFVWYGVAVFFSVVRRPPRVDGLLGLGRGLRPRGGLGDLVADHLRRLGRLDRRRRLLSSVAVAVASGGVYQGQPVSRARAPAEVAGWP